MCGILGVKFLKKNKEAFEFVEGLMQELKIRGTHSFGISYYDNGKIKTEKSFTLDTKKFINSLKSCNGDCFIFHNRYSTSGDWKDMKNNQPITVDGVGSIAFNGVLSMKTKQEFEKEYAVECDSDNDAEVFLRKLEQGINIVDFIKSEESCSFASVLLSDNRLYGIRNNKRPLYFYKDNNIELFISTTDAIHRAGGDYTNAIVVEPYDAIWL